MADYPGSIYSPRERANRSGVSYDPNKKTVWFKEDADAIENEIIAVETELGTNPKGAFDSVKDFLAYLLSKVTGVLQEQAFEITLDGFGSQIPTGLWKTAVEIPFDCEIQEVVLLADQTGSIVVDIWKDTYANYQPTVDDSICGSAKPTITSSNKSKDDTLTGWTKTLSKGDILMFNVDSCSTITWVTLSLKVNKT